MLCRSSPTFKFVNYLLQLHDCFGNVETVALPYSAITFSKILKELKVSPQLTVHKCFTSALNLNAYHNVGMYLQSTMTKPAPHTR